MTCLAAVVTYYGCTFIGGGSVAITPFQVNVTLKRDQRRLVFRGGGDINLNGYFTFEEIALASVLSKLADAAVMSERASHFFHE
jgi:hypothetical protein